MEKNKHVLYLEMYLYAAKKLIIKKDCTLQDLKEAENYLNKCRGIAPQDETRIDVWLGKLELKRSKLANDGLEKQICLNSAKNSFFMSIAKHQPHKIIMDYLKLVWVLMIGKVLK